jgi:hypothetical protein
MDNKINSFGVPALNNSGLELFRQMYSRKIIYSKAEEGRLTEYEPE